ncbi:MAG: hypothetical protein ACP6IP_03725 [Candidatus Njordarchaeia archaeon]
MNFEIGVFMKRIVVQLFIIQIRLMSKTKLWKYPWFEAKERILRFNLLERDENSTANKKHKP